MYWPPWMDKFPRPKKQRLPKKRATVFVGAKPAPRVRIFALEKLSRPTSYSMVKPECASANSESWVTLTRNQMARNHSLACDWALRSPETLALLLGTCRIYGAQWHIQYPAHFAKNGIRIGLSGGQAWSCGGGSLLRQRHVVKQWWGSQLLVVRPQTMRFNVSALLYGVSAEDRLRTSR